MIIKRYLFQETLKTFLIVILVILLIAVSHKIVRFVALAASGHISSQVLFKVILFQIPELIAFLLPIGLFLAILLSYSRFFADSEIPVMFACGISWKQLTSIAISLGLMVLVIDLGLTCYWNPKFAYQRELLMRAEGPQILLQTVSPGRFHSFQNDRLVLYVSDITPERSKMKNIFIAEKPKEYTGDTQWSVIYAKSGQIVEQNQEAYLELKEGMRYNGIPGHNDYNVIGFERYQRLLEEPQKPSGLYFHRTMPTMMLWQNPIPSHLAELQWRFSVPLSALILALLAVPLSRTTPREGRFGRIFAAILICIIYFNLLTICKRWIAHETIGAFPGMGWVHMGIFVGAIVFLMQSSGTLKSLTGIFRNKHSVHA